MTKKKTDTTFNNRMRISSVLSKIIEIVPEKEDKISNDAKKYWSSSQENSTIQDLSHWRGSGRWCDDESWNKIGKKHFFMYKKLCDLTEMTGQIRSMIEWGPGGGANLIWFSKELNKIYGIDISSPNLDECERQLMENEYFGFNKVLIPANSPEDCVDLIKPDVDFFLSTAVYQHFPSKEYGIKVTKLAYKLLSNQSIALIQIRYDDGSNRFAPKTRDYYQNAVNFTSYKIEEFWNIANEIGFKPIAIYLKPEVNYAYYFLGKGDIKCQNL